MNRVAIFGCRDGEYLLDQVTKNGKDKYEVACLCDNDKKYIGTHINNITVLDADGMCGLYRNNEIDKVIICVRKGYSRYCIIKQLEESGIREEDIILVKPSSLTFRLPIVFDRENVRYDQQWLHMNENKKPIIHHLEAHAADGCNLNCKGCLHFSNLYPKDQFPDLDALLKDVEEINRHCEIFQFRVLGGEPLLNDKLSSFLIKLREILPHSDLAVISNGILIPKTDPELFKVMSKNNIGFNLTLYPPTLNMRDKIEDKLNQYNVPFGSHVAKTDEFEKFMTLTEHAARDHAAFRHCVPRGILVIKEKKLYKCPVQAYRKAFVEKFQLSHSEEFNGIDLYSIDKQEWQGVIEKLTDEPIALCGYCSEKPEFYDWSVGTSDITDWLVK